MPSPVSVHFSSVAQLCLTFCDPVDHSTPGFPSHHQLLELIQFHVHWVGDVIQPSHSLSSPSPPAFTLSHHQGLYQWVRSLHKVAKLLELQLQHQSWIFRTDFNHFQFTLIHEHNIPGSYAILFLTASVFTSITNHIHSWVFFSLWLCLFILSGVVSPLFSRSILGTYWPGEVFFSVLYFCLSILFMVFSRKEYWVVCHSLLQGTMFFSKLSNMTNPSWVALHGMVHSFIESVLNCCFLTCI